MRPRFLIFAFLFVLMMGANAGAEQRVYNIGLGFPFPPWDVGPLQGVNYDLLTAICAANLAMRCRIEVRPYSDCVGSDAAGHPIIGAGLRSGSIDGCVGWLDTPEREQLGGEFANAYSFGPTPQLIASDSNHVFDGLQDGQGLGGANVGFLSGFFNNPSCLTRHHGNFGSQVFEGSQSGQDAMIAALVNGTIALAFWDSVETVPAGTHVLGAPINDCGPLLSMIVFPPSTARQHKSDDLRRDFNCGLALIRANGVMANICASSTHPGGDPQCILEGPPPTVQCLAENPPPKQ
jgi:hypothetical protein